MSDTPDTASAASATDAQTASPYTQEALNALTPDARHAYETSGEWPEPAKVTTTATPEKSAAAPQPEQDEDAEDAKPAATAATGAQPAAATTEKPISKRQQQINDLIRRSTESELRAKALEAEIEALKGKTAPAAKEAPKAEAVVDPKDPEPQEANFETYGAYVKAQARWEVRQAKREAEADAAQRAQAESSRLEQFQTTAKTWIGRRDSFIAKHPEKAEPLMAFLDTVHAGTPIGDTILESEVGADVADYLASHRDEAERIARLAPIAALRALGKLEAKFDSTLTSASASAGPAAKTVTSAPAPPMTLTSRSAAPADPAAAALDRGDYAAWEAEENRKALLAVR